MEKIRLKPIDLRTVEGRENYIEIFKRVNNKNIISRFTTKIVEKSDDFVIIQCQIITKYRDVIFDCYYNYLSSQEMDNIIENKNVIDLRSTYVKDLDLSKYNKSLIINCAFAYLDGYTFINNTHIEDICFYHCTFGEGNKDFTNCTYSNNTLDFSCIKFPSGQLDFSNSNFGEGKFLFTDFLMGSGDVYFNNCDFESVYIDFSNFILKKGEFVFANNRCYSSLFDFTNCFIGQGEKDFSNTVFSQCEAVFNNSIFLEGEMSFYNTDFGNGDTFFTNTDCTNCNITFLNAKGYSLKFFNNIFTKNVNMNFQKVHNLELINCTFEKTLCIDNKDDDIKMLSLHKTIFNNQLWIDTKNCIDAIPKFYRNLYKKNNITDKPSDNSRFHNHREYYLEIIKGIKNNTKQEVHNNIGKDMQTIMAKYKNQGQYENLDKMHVAYYDNFTKSTDYIYRSNMFKMTNTLARDISSYGTEPSMAIRHWISNLLFFASIYFIVSVNEYTIKAINSVTSILYIIFALVIFELFGIHIIGEMVYRIGTIKKSIKTKGLSKLEVFKIIYAIVILISVILFIVDGATFAKSLNTSIRVMFNIEYVLEYKFSLPNDIQILIPVMQKITSTIIGVFVILTLVRKYQR